MKRLLSSLIVLFSAVLLTTCSGGGGGGGGGTNPTYTVTYNGDGYTGGSAPIDPATYEQGQVVTVLGNTGYLERTGYSFLGWNTQANGSGTTYTPGEIFTMCSADVTLYAKWAVNPTYTVTYNGNGNTGGSVPSDTSKYEQGQIVTTLGNTGNLVKSGYAFSGWNTQADGAGTTYAEPQTFTMSGANVTLYAVWTTGPVYTVIYDGNGSTSGSVPIDTTNYVPGQTVAVFANPGIKAGYSFSGWNTQADESGTTYTPGETFTTGSADITLYAMWTANVPRFLYVTAIIDYTGVSSYAIDSSTGRLKAAGQVWAGPGPITIAPSGKFAYITYMGDIMNPLNVIGSIYQFTIGADGALSAMTTSTVATGYHPGPVTIDPSGKYAYVGNSGDNTISQYTIGPDGALSPMTPATVVTGLYPSSVTVGPSGKYVYVANNGDSTFSQYKIGTGGLLSAMTPSMVASGQHPRSITIDPLGKFAYVAHYYDNSVLQYTISPTTGALSPMTPSTVAAGSGPFSVTVDPSGRYAYVANLKDGTISQYSIDATTGALSPITPSTVAVEGGLQSVVVDPSGKYAYVGGISLYKIGPDGALTPNSPATIIAQPIADSLAISYGTASAAAVAKYAYVVNSGNNTVSQYTIDATTGALTPMTPSTVDAGSGPISITVDAFSKYAYVANSQDDTVSQYTISAEGALSAMTPSTVLTGRSPSFVTADSFGDNVFVTNYSDNTVSLFYDANSYGNIYLPWLPWPPDTVATGLGPASVTVAPSGKYAYVTNFSDNTVSQYTVDATGAIALSSMTPSTVAAGAGPVSVTVDASVKYAYVANFGDNSVSQYTISATTGVLTPMTPSTVAAGAGPRSITVDPSGKYAYAANFSDNTISQYLISPTTGALSPMTPSTVATGTGPRSVMVDPSGKFAYAVNEGDNSISQYTISATTGALTPMAPATVGSGLSPRAIKIVGSYQ